MRTACDRLFSTASRRRTALATTLCVMATPAAAIPSPELVVGSLTSLSQLAAVLSALLGGGAVAAGARFAGRQENMGQLRRLRRLTAVFALTAFAAAAAALYLYVAGLNRDQARLEATLLRPTPKAADGAALDPLLKEIPFSAQVNHPRAITTREAHAIAEAVAKGNSSQWIILDIRETAETEAGSLPGSIKVRFPDLPQSRIDFTGKKPLLICHNGNRSAETCEALAAKGIDCRFIAGGLEKWLSEGFALPGFGARSVEDLRTIPDYPNHHVLLTTERVHALVAGENAIFVDVRYPGEFVTGHLPDAINVPLRPTPSADLARLVAALPDRPIIAPCYDRRSCFFGEILGLTLTRAGRDYRGRYTLPWEYFKPSKRPPHVEALLAQANKSYWQRAGEALSAALIWIAKEWGLPLALLAMALVSRLLVLPFSLKAERDQISARAIEADVTRLKRDLAGDPPRRARALRALYTTAGLTPGRNLVALLFLPVLALSVEASVAAAGAVPAPFHWIADLSGHDPYYILPATFAVLLGVYLQLAFVATRRAACVVWLLAVPLLLAAGALLPAAACLYMCASAALLLVQRTVVSGLPGWHSLKLASKAIALTLKRARAGHAGIVPLADTAALASAGNKALRLAELRGAGLPVPDGLVLTSAFLAMFQTAPPAERARHLNRIWRVSGGVPLAVRSSGASEDGAHLSFAGVFESVLDVERDTLEAAILRVASSFDAARGASYAASAGAHGRGNILVQPMIAAEFAGVVFTEDPASPAHVLIEFVTGPGEQLVSGRTRAEALRYGRMTGRMTGAAPFDAAQIVALALAAEARYGKPQDVEWAYAKGKFFILQSRDITTLPSGMSAAEACERRSLVARARCSSGTLVPETVLFHQPDMAELLPRPTRCSFSLLEDMWKSGGSVDLALRSLGFEAAVPEDGTSPFVTIFGRLFADTREEQRRTQSLSRLAARRLEKSLDDLDRTYRADFLPQHLNDMRLAAASDLSRLLLSELKAALAYQRRHFIMETYAVTSRINIAAQIALTHARDALEAQGLAAADFLAHIPPTDLDCGIHAAIAARDAGDARPLAALIGHRAECDYELSAPRFGEHPAALRAAADRFRAAAAKRMPDTAHDAESQLPRKLAQRIAVARRLQTLKEDAKHHALRELAILRALLVALGSETRLGDTIFHLTLDEISGFDATTAGRLEQLAVERAANAEALRTVPAYSGRITAAELEGRNDHGAASTAGAELRGNRVSGRDVVLGRAYVVGMAAAEEGRPLASFADGDILIAPMIHPAWLADVVRATGVISTTGGWLSHMAIVAREHGVAMITGVRGLERLETGMCVRMTGDGCVEILPHERERRVLAAAAE